MLDISFFKKVIREDTHFFISASGRTVNRLIHHIHVFLRVELDFGIVRPPWKVVAVVDFGGEISLGGRLRPAGTIKGSLGGGVSLYKVALLVYFD